tara:strand:+ start:3371 stop:4072 length:702 start_codon:yes stop_codon:yes gene_type:complete
MSNKKTKITRDTDGLIKGVDYIFNEDGLIDWRKMIKVEHLVPNKDRTSETDVTKLKDNQLIILLGGIKDLAQIRGYTDVAYKVTSPSPDYVVSTCSISWLPNYETEGRPVTFSAIGDASPNNTKSFARHFLGPIAENRAFVRCVRNFLRINIVGAEELGDTSLSQEQDSEKKSDPYNILDAVMKEKGITFNQIKGKLVKEGYENADELNDASSLPKFKIFELVERLKKVKKKD